MSANTRLEDFIARLRLADPQATVTRDHKRLDDDLDQLNAGDRIYAVVSSGFPEFGSLPSFAEDERHEFIVICRQQNLDNITGDEIEAIEFDMLDKIKGLLNDDFWSQSSLCLKLKSAKGSMQLEHPVAAMAFWMMFDGL